MTLRLVLAAVVMAFAVASAPSALADGDPASDYLATVDVYTPYSAPHLPAAAVLTKNVKTVFARGLRLKVAVIASRADLGSIPQLFGKPAVYAHFLGVEIAQFYVGPLLIAMPSGFGIYDGGRGTAAEARVLARLKPGGSSTSTLVASTTAAVQKLLAAGALRSKDILPPSVYPQVPLTHPGETISLKYLVLEDSERSSEVVTVLAGTTTLATFKVPLHQALFNQTRSVQWTVPDPAPDNLHFCVVASDVSGNRSKATCLPIKTSA